MKQLKLYPLAQPVTKTIEIPGSKSYTNRALAMAALTKNPVIIHNPLVSDDTTAMIACLNTLGITVETKKNELIVNGSIDDVVEGNYELNANLAATAIRFLLPILTVVPGTKILTGNEGLNKRPIGELVNGLRQLGAQIEYLGKEGFPPLKITSSKLNAKEVTMKGDVSSQFFSALFMIAPVVGGLTIKVAGKQISKPYIDMTIDSLKQFGITVENDTYQTYNVAPGQTYSCKEYIVEGDFSSAGYFFAIAALTESTITLKNLNPQSRQADKKLIEVLEKMGNTIQNGENEITIIGKGIKPIEIDMIDFPDQAQTVAALVAFADGKSILRGLESLHVKETDRLQATVSELTKMQVKTEATYDTLAIYGGNPKHATIDTYKDHRMAMSFAVAGAKLSGMIINEPDVVNKTFPEFWDKLNELGIKHQLLLPRHSRAGLRQAQILSLSKSGNPETPNEKEWIPGLRPGMTDKKTIVLIGFMGSGKSTIARLLAKKLNVKLYDMDKLIERKAGKRIGQIFEEDGEIAFREIEIAVAKELQKIEDGIISTGGGAVMNKIILDYLRKNSLIIYLYASFETILRRIDPKVPRPLFGDNEEAKKLFNLRAPLYKNYADLEISTENKTPKSIVEEINNNYEHYS